MSDKNLGTFKFTIAQGIQKPTKFNELEQYLFTWELLSEQAKRQMWKL